MCILEYFITLMYVNNFWPYVNLRGYNVGGFKMTLVAFCHPKLYVMEGQWIDTVKEEKEEVDSIIDTSLKFSKHYIKAKNHANKILEFINRNVSYKSM